MDIAGTDMYAVADEDGFMEPEATGNHIPPQAAPQIPAVQPIHTPIQQQIAPQAQAVAPVTYSITCQGGLRTAIKYQGSNFFKLTSGCGLTNNFNRELF